MNGVFVIIALANGMLGGFVLVLPILAKQSGIVYSLIIILMTGFFSYYSCLLCLKHLGDSNDFDEALSKHFNDSKIVSLVYDLLVGINLFFLLMLYFNLIMTQWIGFVGYHIEIPIVNAVGLIGLTIVLNYFDFGVKWLSIGIISIFLYCVFLIYLVADGDYYKGNRMNLFGKGSEDLVASMGQAFAIQTFFIPILRQGKEQDQGKNMKYLRIVYLIGTIVYLFIAFAGSFGILNRQPLIKDPENIEDYFEQGSWEIILVGIAYLIHLYSAFGQFLLICKKRIFGIFFRIFEKFEKCQIKKSKDGTCITPFDGIFIVVSIGLILMSYLIWKLKTQFLIEINSAFIGFFYIYLLPAVVHIKCLYGKRSDGSETENRVVKIDENYRVSYLNSEQQNKRNLDKTEIKENMIELQESQRGISNQQKYEKDSQEKQNSNKNPNLTTKVSQKCKCQKPSNKIQQIFEGVLICLMIILGICIMIIGMFRVVKDFQNK